MGQAIIRRGRIVDRGLNALPGVDREGLAGDGGNGIRINVSSRQLRQSRLNSLSCKKQANQTQLQLLHLFPPRDFHRTIMAQAFKDFLG